MKNFDEIYAEIENEAVRSYPGNLLAKYLSGGGAEKYSFDIIWGWRQL